MVAISSLATSFVLMAVAVRGQLQAVSGGVPDACKNECQPLVDHYGAPIAATPSTPVTGSPSACYSDLTCRCSDESAAIFKSCYVCAIDSKSLDIKRATSDMFALIESCKNGGIVMNLDLVRGDTTTSPTIPSPSPSPGPRTSTTPSGNTPSNGNSPSPSPSTGSASSLQMSSFAAVFALGGLALL